MKKLLPVILFFLTISFSAISQDEPLTTKSKKAAKNFNEAKIAYQTSHFDEAVKLLLIAIKEDTSFIEAHALLGFTYESMAKNENALTEFKKVVALNPNFFPSILYTIGSLDVEQMHYTDGLGYLQAFAAHGTKDQTMKDNTPRLIADCKFGAEALNHPVPFEPKNMGPAINTRLNEYFPSITADGNTFLFTRELTDSLNPGYLNEDFYMSNKINGQWDNTFNLGRPLNTPLNEGAPTLSATGRFLIFCGCDRPDSHGSCDLYYSVKYGNQWSQAKNLGSPVNSKYWESQPCLSTDGRTLYFVRGIVGGDGIHSEDIYVTELSDSGYWSVPVKLGDSINTTGREECPYIAADNQTLYFCSDGWPGMGGTDIFMSRRKPDGSWGTPKNLGYPINTSSNQTGIIVDPNGQLAYFSDDRPGGYGGLDIYQFNLYDSIKPAAVTYMKGKVFDANTKQPLSADFSLIDLSNGSTIMQSNSLKYDGSFLVCIPLHKNYALNVAKKGYLFYSENFELKDSNSSRIHPYTINIPLQPIDTGAHIVLKNIFFPTNKFDLKPESQIELDKLVAFLQLNPMVKIEISGHTDNVGTPQSNKTLSQNRAKSVYDYLVAHSIAADRLTYKGYGQTRSIATNDTEEGRALNRRTEMKIVAK
ncbi:MAG TPA: OmpA family protein [Bacteroidia bacterium]|nr:OmpA family protein [Bacteroidia bacterium]